MKGDNSSMRKLISIFLLILTLFLLLTSCSTKLQKEINLTPEPFELIIYEQDGAGYIYHKVLYNKDTEMYHEYRYYYHETGYRNLDHIDYHVYDKNGKLISSEELSE